MKATQARWSKERGWVPAALEQSDREAQLVLVFGSTQLFKDEARLGEIRAAFPSASVVGCTTAGEIRDTEVTDDSLTVTAVRFCDS